MFYTKKTVALQPMKTISLYDTELDISKTKMNRI